MNSSRTNLRLQLMREQSMLEQQQKFESYNGNQSPGLIDAIAPSSSPLAIKMSTSNSNSMNTGGGGGGGSSGGSPGWSLKSSPIIISQPIRFTGNRLVHLPPQIIHVQQHQQQQAQPQQIVGEDMGRRNLTLSNSLPPGLPQNTPPKMPRTTYADHGGRVTTPQYGHGQQQQQHHRISSGTTSRHSPDELSPGGYGGDSPQSNSFTSAQSELDDIIIDEILSMEEEQQRRDPDTATSKMPNSLSYADNLEALLTNGRNVPFYRQVSNSAPTSTIDIEGLVREELLQEQEMVRDRRKKDIHNMIERRRRYNINDRIKELGTMLPKACTEDLKLNKGTILKASVEYIRVLRRDQEKMHQILQRYQNVEQDNKIMAMRIQELEQRLKQHGVPVPRPESSYLTSDSNVIDRRPIMDGRNRLIDRPIKTEPLDDDQTPQPRPDHPAPVFHTLASLQQQPHHQHQQQQQQQQQPSHQLPPLPQGACSTPNPAPVHHQLQPPQSNPNPNRLLDYGNAQMVGGHSYAISAAESTQMPAYYAQAQHQANFGNEVGVLETPPVVNNNLSLFGDRRAPLGSINQHSSQQQQERSAHMQQQQQHHHHHELMMDLGSGTGGGVSAVGSLVSSSTAALISSTDPLMSDSRLVNSQVASPEVQWDSQAFSPEGERMDFMAQ